MNNLKKLLKEEHDGSTAIETTILLPLIFGTFLLLLYFLFMVLAYIAYGNIATSIAHQMNMRQSGYQVAVDTYYNPGSGNYIFPQIYTCKMQEGPQSRYAEQIPGQFLTEGQVVCIPESRYLRAGTYFALDITGRDGTLNMIGDQFILPYVQVDKITVQSSKPLNFGSGQTGAKIAANAVISVSVEFKVMNPLGVFNWHAGSSNYSSLITITSKGYDVIA
jgi:hypothetical protein